MDKIVRINMTYLTADIEDVPEQYKLLGGRSLTDRIIVDEVDPRCQPIGPSNKLVFGTGLLNGTMAPCSGRLSCGGKSPLTGGIKESNSGGPAGQLLAKMGIKAVILEGKPRQEKNTMWYIVHITNNGAEILEAPTEITGKGTAETCKILREKYGNKAVVMAIGQAGEMRATAACITVTNTEGDPSRNFGRGGLGAVMGSKMVKAIIINSEGAEYKLPYADEEKFKEIAREWSKEMVQSKKGLTNYGTVGLLTPVQKVGGLPTKNWRFGQYQDWEKIRGEELHRQMEEYGGKTGHACHPGCVIRCSNIIRDMHGNYITSSLEFETVALFGSNCLINDLVTIGKLNAICNDVGVDTIDTAMACGIAMEAGLVKWGDGEGLIKLLKEMEQMTVLGRVLACGATTFGKVFGQWRIAETKGQAMAAYDPRAMKGTGSTYATSTMGGDHTVGNALPGRGGLDPSKIERQASLSRRLQIWSVGICDAMGLCLFVGPQKENVPYVVGLINARYGTDWDREDIQKLGEDTIKLELQFNRAAGLPDIDFPEFMRIEAVPPFDLVFDMPEEELQRIHHFEEPFENQVDF